MISISYDTLFTIELLHPFFTSGKCPDFIIEPSPQTAALLKGYKVITKQADNKLYALIESDDSKHPSFALPQNMQFTFFLQLRNPQFWVYTSLPLLLDGNRVYYFTNRISNTGNNKTFLSSPTPYSNTVTYKPNDTVTAADGFTYRALQTTKNITPANGDNWMKVDNNRYATGADIMPLLPSKSRYVFDTPQSSATVKVRGFKPADPNAYSSPVLTKTIAFDTPVSSFSLGFLPSGKYRVKVNNDAEKLLYINDELNAAQTLAVIDLYSEATLPDGCKMLDDDNALLSPVYSLAFINRATIWKYIMKSANGTIQDNNNVYQFSSPASGVVSSVAPIPLSDKALNLKLFVGAREHSPIACATPQRLSHIKRGNDEFDCSEIFLNY